MIGCALPGQATWYFCGTHELEHRKDYSRPLMRWWPKIDALGYPITGATIYLQFDLQDWKLAWFARAGTHIGEQTSISRAIPS